MKKLITLVVLVACYFVLEAQEKSWYVNTNYEVMFSSAMVEYGSNDVNNVVRFAPWFNLQWEYNYDFSQNAGFLVGLGFRNLGFIYDVPALGVEEGVNNNEQLGGEYATNSKIRKKFRNYTFGIPVGFKLGNMNRGFFMAGYELEIPFAYKEKTFINGDKEFKHTRWFDSAIPTFYQSVFAGFQIPGGALIKFKYYFTDFFNQSFVQSTTPVDGGLNQNVNWTSKKNFYPTKANVFYVSITFRLLKDTKFYYSEFYDDGQYSTTYN